MKKKAPTNVFPNGEIMGMVYEDYDWHFPQEQIDTETNDEYKAVMLTINSMSQEELIAGQRENDAIRFAYQSLPKEEAIKEVPTVALENNLKLSGKGCCGGAPEEFKEILKKEIERRKQNNR